ncbi:ABC transporter substrate-binding protein [Mycolicibacterium sp. BiH015]|uniref:ABC transporter substrate-binding protein n=1 Tax=Mycolicibacterium sp. BiH015 TaxID=3018808 RepID=UPI0022E89C44|nr:ABC transporter substrate-binding protein [Mycolicibacterium sp. BiH015]MDA2891029.1 ABC transporter substrate-binding protein [Mycolicibacterium sp. BiH015]
MTSNTARRTLWVIATVIAMIAGCSEPPAPSEGLTRLRVALFPAGNSLPVHAAVTRGIFERHGLDVTITDGPDLPLFMAALVDGQYDIAMNTPTLVLVGAMKGLDIQVVSSTSVQSRPRPNAVWITKDDSIATLGELRGKTVAVPSLTGIITDSIVYLLSRNGLQRNDVRFIQTPFPAMGDQLAAGQVDAVVATLPYSTAIASRGFTVHEDVVVEAVQEASDGAVQDAVTTVWTAQRSFAAKHPEAIRAWRDALRDAIAYLDQDEDGARALMSEWLTMSPEVVRQAPLPDWTVDISPAQLGPYVDIARAAGSIDSEPDVNSLVWQSP